MAYAVDLTERAERDLVLLYSQVHAEDSDAALKWYRRLKDAILSQEEQANRCPVTAESQKLRHCLFGNEPHLYRVIYRIPEKRQRVEVLHIRHGARRRFQESISKTPRGR